MILCEVCQSINIRSLLASFQVSEAFAVHESGVFGSNRDYLFSTENFQPHQDDFVALRNAARAGCEFCDMVWAYHAGSLNSPKAHNDSKCECKDYLGPVRLVIYQGVYDRAPLLIVVVKPKPHAMSSADGYVAAELEMCIAKGAQIPLEDMPLLARLEGDERPSDLSSELCLSMGENWLNKCLHEHAECAAKGSQQTVLPTRVIDVGTVSQAPFLYVSENNQIGKWAALSYCWGGNSTFTLNKASFPSLRDGLLPLLKFPPTLRDAIIVTRTLGIQYIWIDSLCIFQDDTNDWRIEASRMGNVYRHAVLTIAATSAESVNAGFLDKRGNYFNCALPWNPDRELPHESQRHPQMYPIFVRQCEPLKDDSAAADSHWATRGWTFQEELMSPRLLLYTFRRTLWRCYTGTAVEPKSDVSGDSQSLFSQLKDIILESSNPAKITKDDPKESPADATYSTWYNLLTQYSKRNLTFDKDCLPAIAGFANYFQAALKDSYCAGLWKQDILYGLIWNTGSKVDSTSNKPLIQAATETPLDDTYPSWSWIRAFSMRVTWPYREEQITYSAQLIDVEVYGAAQDDFGIISGGKLTLKAPYQHIDLKLTRTAFPPWKTLHKLAQIVLARPEFLAGTETSRSIVVPKSNVTQRFTFIRVMQSHNSYRPKIWLLLLQPVSTNSAKGVGEQLYRRVALVFVQPYKNDEDNSEEEEQTDRLQDAVYKHVIKKDWPQSRFAII